MEINEIIAIGREAIYCIVYISSPILMLSLIIGLVISLLQALTQIQESTLTFVPKMFGLFFSIIVFMPHMYKKLVLFTDHVVQRMINLS